MYDPEWRLRFWCLEERLGALCSESATGFLGKIWDFLSVYGLAWYLFNMQRVWRWPNMASQAFGNDLYILTSPHPYLCHYWLQKYTPGSIDIDVDRHIYTCYYTYLCTNHHIPMAVVQNSVASERPKQSWKSSNHIIPQKVCIFSPITYHHL